MVSVALNTLTDSMQLGRNEMLTEFVGFYPHASNFTFLFLNNESQKRETSFSVKLNKCQVFA